MLIFLVIFVVGTRCLVVEGIEECVGKCPHTENGVINYLSHNNCNKYCVCVAGQPQVMLCKPDEHWSEEHEICTHPVEAKCELKASDAIALGCIDDCPNYHVLIGHKYCSKYCNCENFQANVKDCREGYYFSTSEQTCVEWERSDCYVNSEPPTKPPTKPPRPTSSLPTRPPSKPPTKPPTKPPVKPPTKPPTDSKGCIGDCPLCNSLDKTHQLPHKDPTKFCKCDWGKPVVFQCPDDLIYIEKEEVCGYPYGGCDDKKSEIES